MPTRTDKADQSHRAAVEACGAVLANMASTDSQLAIAEARRDELHAQRAQAVLDNFHARTEMLRGHVAALSGLIGELENDAGPASVFAHLPAVVTAISTVLAEDEAAENG